MQFLLFHFPSNDFIYEVISIVRQFPFYLIPFVCEFNKVAPMLPSANVYTQMRRKGMKKFSLLIVEILLLLLLKENNEASIDKARPTGKCWRPTLWIQWMIRFDVTKFKFRMRCVNHTFYFELMCCKKHILMNKNVWMYGKFGWETKRMYLIKTLIRVYICVDVLILFLNSLWIYNGINWMSNVIDCIIIRIIFNALAFSRITKAIQKWIGRIDERKSMCSMLLTRGCVRGRSTEV